MKIAIITPYYSETHEQISRCIESVSSQGINIEHFLIADGNPRISIESLGIRHIVLDQNHNDYGNTPRAIGGLIAASEGFDAVGFLDADNWLDNNHVSTCLNSIENSPRTPDYIICRRRWVRIDGSTLPYESLEDTDGSHVDTNCLILLRGSLHTVARWGLIPSQLSSVGDRIFVAGLRADGLIWTKNDIITINYLCTWSNVFKELGESIPYYAKSNINISSSLTWLESLTPLESEYLRRRIGIRIAYQET